eukprot:1395927-Pyramimonas_sp.AAC.1
MPIRTGLLHNPLKPLRVAAAHQELREQACGGDPVSALTDTRLLRKATRLTADRVHSEAAARPLAKSKQDQVGVAVSFVRAAERGDVG